MGRGGLAAGGSIYHADLVFGAVQLVGQELARGASILDFGCSSGRVIRVVHAYRPDLKCLGCDPNEDAIRWAERELPQIEFFVNAVSPPLGLPDRSLDCAFAISIWSHYGPRAALAWLSEMHRVLRPGALLILTTHSLQSIAYYHQKHLRALDDLEKTLVDLEGTGFHFFDVFGEKGDWGIVNSEWGEAYISAEWLLNRVTPRWEVALYRTGANEDNQDVVVLRRR
jgi:SAM-dependent methyltransferase